jgi:hypothetical protein
MISRFSASMNEASPEKHNENEQLPNREFHIEINPKVGQSLQEGLQVGFDAIGQLLNGFVSSIKDSVAPDVMKNIATGQWLSQVANCLEEIATASNQGQPTAPSKAGELSFYLEQLEFQLEGSRVQNMTPSLKDRLERVLKSVENNELDARTLQSTIGFFQAASKSSLPPTSN